MIEALPPELRLGEGEQLGVAELAEVADRDVVAGGGGGGGEELRPARRSLRRLRRPPSGVLTPAVPRRQAPTRGDAVGCRWSGRSSVTVPLASPTSKRTWTSATGSLVAVAHPDCRRGRHRGPGVAVWPFPSKISSEEVEATTTAAVALTSPAVAVTSPCRDPGRSSTPVALTGHDVRSARLPVDDRRVGQRIAVLVHARRP